MYTKGQPPHTPHDNNMYVPATLVAVLLFSLVSNSRMADADVAFDADIRQHFIEHAGPGRIRSLEQHGKGHSDKKPVRDIRRASRKADASKPILLMVSTPKCDACDKLKESVNKGTKARKMFKAFDCVHLSAPLGSHKWCALGHDAYAPQVYFYTRDGRHLAVENAEEEDWCIHSCCAYTQCVHSLCRNLPRAFSFVGCIGGAVHRNKYAYLTEAPLFEAMEEAFARDYGIAQGEDFDVVLGIKKPPPPPPPPVGCMEVGTLPCTANSCGESSTVSMKHLNGSGALYRGGAERTAMNAPQDSAAKTAISAAPHLRRRRRKLTGQWTQCSSTKTAYRASPMATAGA